MSANDFKGQGMGPWCSAESFIFLFTFSQFYLFLSFERVKLLLVHLAKLSVRPGIFLPPEADRRSYLKLLRQSWLYIEQRLLSYNTCRGFLILRLDNSSRLLHLPGLIVLAGSKKIKPSAEYQGPMFYPLKPFAATVPLRPPNLANFCWILA